MPQLFELTCQERIALAEAKELLDDPQPFAGPIEVGIDDPQGDGPLEVRLSVARLRHTHCIHLSNPFQSAILAVQTQHSHCTSRLPGSRDWPAALQLLTPSHA